MADMPKRHLIWSDRHLDLDDWKTVNADCCPGMTDDQMAQLMYEDNSMALQDERRNLDIFCDREIIVIGDLGLWHGRVSGYKMIPSGNIKDCLYADADSAEWYVDELGDLRCDAAHHDGTNYYLYRAIKPDATDAQVERLKSLIYEGKATRSDITRVTRRLGDKIGAVYGWHFKQSRRRPPTRSSAKRKQAR